MILAFVLTILIVGVVTAGLTIKFDRFFAILMLMFLFKYSVFDAVNVFLWIIMLGALMILLDNKEKIAGLPKQMKIKMFVMIPAFTIITSFLGTMLFTSSSKTPLIIVLGILAILYGLRLIIIHFKPEEMDLQNANPAIVKFCGLFGPILSGFSIGFIGTSLKPLKIPFAIRIGKMNMKQVYLGNTVTTFFASSFAIMWHYFLGKTSTPEIFYQQLLLGAALWTGIHYMSEITNLLFSHKWKKLFQIVIGAALVLASIKVFMLL
ncbi:MAG: hypothetical protein DRP58_02855 [Spirochaetes bacterium]|nr:MAG: hypothetical protein DRP58_02855 [Spirochaetota bacterium]